MSNYVMIKPPPIKSKQPSQIQITASQLLIDAKVHQEKQIRPPAQRIMDQQQLDHYKQNKRRQFEDKIRRQRYHMGIWVRYASWRVRSIYQRAIQVDYTNKSLWIKYAQFQMRHKFINHARNIWQRAIFYLPREDQFWYKYAYFEQLMNQYQNVRNIMQRWMTWSPGQKAWQCYVKFQERMNNKEKALQLMYRYLQVFPLLNTYLKVIKYLLKNKNRKGAREIFERVVPELGKDALQEQFFLEFSKFEIKNREYDRAREIFKFGLKLIPKDKCKKLYEQYLSFQKQHGSTQQIEDIILSQRRQHYKNLLAENNLNYDAWLNLLNLEMSTNNFQKIRQVFEAAVKNTPPQNQKRYWRRYIYIWYNYVVFQEVNTKNIERTKQIYQRALNIIPNKIFSFSQLWIMYAYFYLRCGDIQKTRKIFGTAIGKAARPKIFKNYIELEYQLCNMDRVRKIYEKYIECFPGTPNSWLQYAQFEKKLDELQRARSILQLANKFKVEGIPDIDKFISGQQMA